MNALMNVVSPWMFPVTQYPVRIQYGIIVAESNWPKFAPQIEIRFGSGWGDVSQAGAGEAPGGTAPNALTAKKAPTAVVIRKTLNFSRTRGSLENSEVNRGIMNAAPFVFGVF